MTGHMQYVPHDFYINQKVQDQLPHDPSRHEVRPGLTGYAQVNGRNNLAWHDRFRLDTDYIDNMSFWLDIKIIIQTGLKVIRRSGISLRANKDYTLFRVIEEEGNTNMQTKEIGSNFAMETSEILFQKHYKKQYQYACQ